MPVTSPMNLPGPGSNGGRILGFHALIVSRTVMPLGIMGKTCS